MITINSTSIQVPSSLTVGIYTVTGDDTKRNTEAYMLASRIAIKRVVEIEYNYISADNLKIILGLVYASFFFYITFKNPETGNIEEMEVYSGDTSIGIIDEISGVTRYKGVKLSFRQR